MPNVIRISESDANRLRSTVPSYGRRTRYQRDAQRAVFRDLKSRYGIPGHLKLKVEINNRNAADYLVLKDKRSGEALHELAATPAARPAPSYPFPGQNLQRVAPQTSGYGVGAQNSADNGLAVGSISLEDALELLRGEADASDSYADGTKAMPTSVRVEDGRLYFVK